MVHIYNITVCLILYIQYYCTSHTTVFTISRYTLQYLRTSSQVQFITKLQRMKACWSLWLIVILLLSASPNRRWLSCAQTSVELLLDQRLKPPCSSQGCRFPFHRMSSWRQQNWQKTHTTCSRHFFQTHSQSIDLHSSWGVYYSLSTLPSEHQYALHHAWHSHRGTWGTKSSHRSWFWLPS